MSSNRKWLKSLSDRALADEIKYGRVLAESGRHKNFHAQELREAQEEQAARRSTNWRT